MEEGLVDNVVIIHICINLVVVKVKINDITHWDPCHIVARGAGTPIFSQVSKHVDMIAQKVEDRLVE